MASGNPARNRDASPRSGKIGDTAPRDGVLLIAWGGSGGGARGAGRRAEREKG